MTESMPGRFESRRRQRLGLGIRARTALTVLAATIVFLGVFDLRFTIAVSRYVDAAEAAAAGGRYVRAGDALDPARQQALGLAALAASAVLVAGLVAGRVSRR